MKFLCLIPLVFTSVLLSAQTAEKHDPNDDFSFSFQYGPETGISHIFFPKIAYRSPQPGPYYGAFICINIIAVTAISIGVIGGYRAGGLAAETSLAGTFVLNNSDEGNPSGFWLNVNPKVIAGHKIFAGFGPGIYLVKPKRLTTTLWDDVGKNNFELGYSELFRF